MSKRKLHPPELLIAEAIRCADKLSTRSREVDRDAITALYTIADALRLREELVFFQKLEIAQLTAMLAERDRA